MLDIMWIIIRWMTDKPMRNTNMISKRKNMTEGAVKAGTFSIQDICMIGVLTAVIVIMAQISLPMPLGVPMTMQTFAVTLAAIILGPRNSAVASLVYLLLVLSVFRFFLILQEAFHVSQVRPEDFFSLSRSWHTSSGLELKTIVGQKHSISCF